jgi:hypothetical protein
MLALHQINVHDKINKFCFFFWFFFFLILRKQRLDDNSISLSLGIYRFDNMLDPLFIWSAKC